MIRAYSTKDKVQIMELLRKNTPKYFDSSEENAFENYLDHEIEDYFVYEENDKIIAAGGINYFPKEKIARLSWDMIAPNSQGKGIGKTLAQYRINLLNKKPEVELIIVRTTQFAYNFYQKMGFELEKVEKDYWAKNYDLYQMKIKNKNEY